MRVPQRFQEFLRTDSLYTIETMEDLERPKKILKDSFDVGFHFSAKSQQTKKDCLCTFTFTFDVDFHFSALLPKNGKYNLSTFTFEIHFHFPELPKKEEITLALSLFCPKERDYLSTWEQVFLSSLQATSCWQTSSELKPSRREPTQYRKHHQITLSGFAMPSKSISIKSKMSNMTAMVLNYQAARGCQVYQPNSLQKFVPALRGDQHTFLTSTPAFVMLPWLRMFVPTLISSWCFKSKFCPHYIFQVI